MATRLPTITELKAMLSGRNGKVSYETSVTAGPGYEAFRNALVKLEAGFEGLSVGIHDDAGIHHEASQKGKTTVTVAEVAFWNEFGVEGHIPERSWMRATLDRNLYRYQRLLHTYAMKIYDGRMTLEESMESLGKTISSDMRKAVRDFHDPGNAESTIKSKGFDDPLIETRQMLRSITYKIKED